MTTTTKHRKEDAFLLLVLIVVQLGVVVLSPNSRVVDWINACWIDDWTTQCVPTVRNALPWCVDNSSKDRMSALMRTMQKHKPATDARIVPATCFGTNVQLYYLPKRDEFMINPVIIRRDESEIKWSKCRGLKIPHHIGITVRFLNSYFKEQTESFSNTDSFEIECELDSASSN